MVPGVPELRIQGPAHRLNVVHRVRLGPAPLTLALLTERMGPDEVSPVLPPLRAVAPLVGGCTDLFLEAAVTGAAAALHELAAAWVGTHCGWAPGHIETPS